MEAPALRYEKEMRRGGSQFEKYYSSEEGWRLLRGVIGYLDQQGALLVHDDSTPIRHGDEYRRLWIIVEQKAPKIENLMKDANVTSALVTYGSGHEPDSWEPGEEGGDFFSGIDVKLRGNNEDKMNEVAAALEKILYAK